MYNKLFTKILRSSVWLLDSHVRLVWVTLLAAMDREGFAQYSTVGNLAEAARVTKEQAQEAVDILESPEAETAFDEFEGRRIERVPGGWVVLKAPEYNNLVSHEIEKQRTRERVARFRAQKANGKKEEKSTKEEKTKTVTPTTPTYAALHVTVGNEQVRQRNGDDRYTPVTDSYKGVQTSARTEVDIAALRNIGFRRSTAAAVEHEYAQVLEAGADPKEVIKSCQRIYEWTEKGKYARDLADTIRRWQEPQHLWVRTEENGKRRKTVDEVIRDTRTDPDA